MKSNNPKKILFTVGAIAGMGSKTGVDEVIENGGQFTPSGDSVRLADELMQRVSTLYVGEKVTDYQYYYFKKRIKEAPAVTDIRLDGDVLVLIIANGTEERVQPGDGAELPQVDIVEHVPFYEKAWYWIKSHKVVSISGAALLLALVILLIVKRH
jgi:hypothetical protein